ncbi:hypothetical protein [Aquimarina sp. 2201CG5-10]|uniref:hypothetical protein n=1 Tax=Aquimarina callyspongiae TaxID=3098150 RepID=UPI002AB3C895|nr:hypothetical protein [Aquimarina sp. 2201CG5-10]MDY8137546.1 hypothetical protein [Aquimarina sp. 2201CG5-10]
MKLSCSCTKGLGTWTGDYTNLDDAKKDIERYCAEKSGICKPASDSITPPAN